MKIFEIRIGGEKDWICANGIIHALKVYNNTTDLNLIDFENDDEIVEIPKEKWNEYYITNEEGDKQKTFAQHMEKQGNPELFASTAY